MEHSENKMRYMFLFKKKEKIQIRRMSRLERNEVSNEKRSNKNLFVVLFSFFSNLKFGDWNKNEQQNTKHREKIRELSANLTLARFPSGVIPYVFLWQRNYDIRRLSNKSFECKKKHEKQLTCHFCVRVERNRMPDEAKMHEFTSSELNHLCKTS